MDAGPFEHFSLPLKNFYGIVSRYLLTRRRDTKESLSSALDYTKESERKVNQGAAGASLLRKRKCRKDGKE